MLIRSPRLIFTADPDDTSGGTTPEAPETPEAPTDLGYPENTSWRDMEPGEQAAYWRDLAKKHEKAVAKTAAELRAERDKHKTEDERRDDELRRQGEALGAERFLVDAVHGQIRALTGKSDEDVENALSFVDVNKFLTDGVLDKGRLATFAGQLGTAAAPAPEQPQQPQQPQSIAALAAATRQRIGQPQGDRQGGSVKARREEILAGLTAKQ